MVVLHIVAINFGMPLRRAELKVFPIPPFWIISPIGYHLASCFAIFSIFNENIQKKNLSLHTHVYSPYEKTVEYSHSPFVIGKNYI